jgi:two-component system nitrate/nitrite response regulator NarL
VFTVGVGSYLVCYSTPETAWRQARERSGVALSEPGPSSVGAARVSATPVKAAVVGSARAYREALARELGRRSEVRLEARPFPPAEAVAAIEAWSPHLVLIDMPVPVGPVITHDLIAINPTTQVLAINVVADTANVVAWAQSGVAGCVADTASLDEVVGAVRSVMRSEIACSPSLAATLFARATHVSEMRQPSWQGMTRRERQILDLVSQGFSNKEIARLLHVEVSTVKNHAHRLFTKLGVHTREEAAAWLLAAAELTGDLRS